MAYLTKCSHGWFLRLLGRNRVSVNEGSMQQGWRVVAFFWTAKKALVRTDKTVLILVIKEGEFPVFLLESGVNAFSAKV